MEKILFLAPTESSGSLSRHALEALVCGGDQAAVEAVLADPRLSRVGQRRTSRWLAVPDPRRAVLDQAVRDAMAVRIDVSNA